MHPNDLQLPAPRVYPGPDRVVPEKWRATAVIFLQDFLSVCGDGTLLISGEVYHLIMLSSAETRVWSRPLRSGYYATAINHPLPQVVLTIRLQARIIFARCFRVPKISDFALVPFMEPSSSPAATFSSAARLSFGFSAHSLADTNEI